MTHNNAPDTIHNLRATIDYHQGHPIKVSVHGCPQEEFDAIPVPQDHNGSTVWKRVAGVTFFRAKD